VFLNEGRHCRADPLASPEVGTDATRARLFGPVNCAMTPTVREVLPRGGRVRLGPRHPNWNESTSSSSPLCPGSTGSTGTAAQYS
jgi:hypothetical protein